ncbi:MAG: hypothetical protein H7Y36_03640 [Armatimonadetes bacterium]|nr:hypothetical protein [Akkermansiaceae bacterium]
MKPKNSFLLAAICLNAAQTLFADTIILTDGKKLEGSIIREEGENYVLEVQVTDSIRDEMLVAKSQVKKIEIVTADEKAFEKIAGLVPTPERLSASGYESRIKRVEEFLQEYPKSAKVSRVKEMLEVLNDELSVVSDGGIKFGESMVSAEDYLANAYEYESKIAAKLIKDAVSRQDYLGALRRFSKYEIQFGQTEDRTQIVALIQQVLSAYGNAITDNINTLEQRLAERKSGLERMSSEDRAQTQRALDDEYAIITARFEEEKETRQGWITPEVFHKESLEEAKRQVDTEVTRLQNMPKDVPKTPLAEVYRKAWGKLDGGTDEEKKTVIEVARQAKLPQPYVDRLVERAGLEVR